MNAQRTSSVTPSVSSSLIQRLSCALAQYGRAAALWLMAALLIALVPLASQAGLKRAALGGNGAVLALAAQLRAAHVQAASGFGGAQGLQRTPSGRTLMPHQLMRSGAILRDRVAASTVVPISEAVQTYDVFNPSPAFRPLIGYGSVTALNNSSSNPPVYINALAPTNLTPVWSADETFLVFSSNRTLIGGIQPDGSFHIWAISVNGGEAFQVTTSTIGTGANPALPHGEFFPALSANNNKLVFTSDAQSPDTQNLYATGFSSAALTAGATPLNVSSPAVISSLTLRASTEAASALLTGFSSVQHPTFGTSDGQLIVFSALSTNGTYAGHAHIYFLYQSSGGFSNSNQTSYPGKLTDGPADDTDPAFSPDGQFIAFSTTATTISNNPNNAFGPTPPGNVQDPNASQSLTATPTATRSVFLISGGGSGNGIPFGTAPSAGGLSGGRVTIAGTDDYGPAWSNFANQNQFTNPAPGYAYLAFARASSQVAAHDIYYLQVGQGISSPSSETLTQESGGNPAVQLNTDDTGNVYDDIYPSWSPFLSVFSITYSSNRTITYNNPANSQPTETAVSVASGGTVTNPQDSTTNYSVGSGYAGLLISQVLNLDPPTLLRFSANEVVHVQAAGTNPVTGTPNKLAVSGTQNITLTVRLSDREAGIDDTGGPNGGPRAYIQIKDPDSKYQDAKGLEHKVFMKDRRYDTGAQLNRPANDATSSTANALLDDYDFTLPGSDLYSSLYNISGGFINLPLYQRYIYPSYGAAGNFPPRVGQDSVSFVNPRGTHGGQWPVDTTNNPNNTYLFVGKSAVGTTNPYGSFTYPATPGPGRITQHYPGTDPNQFIPHGPEYEAQVINPLFSAGGTTDASPTDYSTPYYLAGVDDQGAFSGGTYGTGTAKDRPDTEWLQLARVPDNQQDHNGGVLYTVTWTTPKSGSDFYVDVVAFDKSAFPNIPGFVYSGQKTNWRIYDNVSGFSTNQTISNEDILVVSDYALGQKFAATTFGGRNFALNLVPKLFGTESYITDVDVNILPDSVYAGIPSAEAKAAAGTGTPARVAFQFAPVVQPFGRETPGAGDYPGGIYIPTQNGLGAQSFIDPIINDGTVNTDGVPNVQSQRYSIWRILSRGPVPPSVLTNYLPRPVLQPAIQDAQDPTYQNIPAATVLDANRCVIWLSPYTGDVVADPGTIDDPGSNGQSGVTSSRLSTTSVLTNFVQAGGRLCVTGQDVGSTLTLGGTVNNTPSTTPGSPNFLPDVLNATLTSTGTDVHLLSGSSDAGSLPVTPAKYTGNRISGNPFYDGTNSGSSFITLGSPTQATSYLTLSGPIQGGYSINYPNYPWLDNLVIGDADYGDSSLSQIPAAKLPIGPATAISTNVQGQSDVIAATNGAQVALSYVIPITPTPFLRNIGAAAVFHDDPYNPAGTGQLPNGGTGSRVVYAAFGLEALTEDYYASASPNSAATITLPSPLPFNQIIPVVIPRNTRSAILHNIVSYLRTGRVTGTVNTDDGSSPDNATVYLRPIGGSPSTRAAFSASTGTGNNGRFTIFGVEAGTYTLVALKSGYRRAVSNAGVSFTLEGDVTKTAAALTITHLPPANIAGVVKDTSNAPISGATVTFTSQDNSIVRPVTTVNGSVTGSTTENYFLQGVPVTTYTATATGPVNDQNLPEYTAAASPDAPFDTGITTQPSSTTQPVNFTLTPILATISGTITSSVGGAAVPGATVTLTDITGAVVSTATAAADGTYTLTGIPAAAYPTATTDTLTVTAPGFASGTLSETVYLGSILTGQNVVLNPIPDGSLQVTVTYAAPVGGPVANAIVTYTAPGGTPQTVTTGADGTVTIPNLPATTPGTFYTVSAIGPNNTSTPVQATTTAAPAQQITVVSGQQATASFVVTRIPPSFSGTVTNAAGGAPLANATITVTDPSGTVAATVKTAADGTYATGPLVPGTYVVTASLAGYGSVSNPAVPVQYGDALTGVNFALAVVPPGSITGTVSDNNGLPVNLAVVTFNSTDGTVTNQTATTAANGTYVIPPAPAAANIPASTYTGNAVGPNNETGTPEYGSDPSAPKTVTVPSSGAATVNFTLPIIPASVSGTVTDAQTSAVVPGATVTLTGPSGTVIGAPVTTDVTGAYTFAGIVATQTPSTYTVTVTKAGYASGGATVVLSLGDHKTLPISLNEQATLYGLVTDGSPDATGQPLSGATLTVTDTSGNIVATIPAPVTTQSGTTSAPDGGLENYSALLLPGTYTVTASKTSYDTQTSAVVTLTNAAPVRVNFPLRSSIGAVGGLVTEPDGTTPVANATVTVTQAGAAATTFTTTGTATTGPDGKLINYSGLLTKGTYTFVVTKGARQSATATATIIGGTFNRIDFTTAANGALPSLYTFPAGLQFVSTPYDYSSLGFDGLFGTLNTAPTGTTPNGNRSHVAVWNPLVGAYALDPNAPADALRLGVGYWVFLKAAVPVLQQGATPSASFVAVALGKGWNQIGVPNPVKDSTGQYVGVAVSRLQFDDGHGGKISYAQASTTQYNVINPLVPLYQYVGSAGYQAVGTTGTLKPWSGYWLYVNVPATLEIPTN